MKNLLSLLAVALLLSGCGGTTKPLDLAEVNAPIKKGDARLVITRDDSALYYAAGAIVAANSQDIATLGREGAIVHDVRAGHLNLNVHALGSFGYYVINMDTKPGKTYRFTISPRGKQMLYAPLPYIGDYINGQNNDKTGYFQIEMVP